MTHAGTHILRWLLASGDLEAAKLHVCPACPPCVTLRDVARAYVGRDPVCIANAAVPGVSPDAVLAVCDVRAEKRAYHTVTAQNARATLAAVCEGDATAYIDGDISTAFVMALDALLHVTGASAHVRCDSGELALDVALKRPTHAMFSVPYKSVRNVDELVAAQRSCAQLCVRFDASTPDARKNTPDACARNILVARCAAGKAMMAFAAPGTVLECDVVSQASPTYTLCALGCDFVVRDPTVTAIRPLHEQVDAVLDCARDYSGTVHGTLVVDRSTSNRLIKDTYRLLAGKNVSIALVDCAVPKKNCAFCNNA